MVAPAKDGTYMSCGPGATPSSRWTSGRQTCFDSERGLLGIAVDPRSPQNRFIYLYYTFKKFGVCDQQHADDAGQPRLALRARRHDLIDPASETVLVDNIPSPDGNHNAGDLRFGKDGYLYVSVGDGGCDYRGDSGCLPSTTPSRDRNVLLGKILRDHRDGGDPARQPVHRPRHAPAATSPACTTPGNELPGDLRLGPAQPVPVRLRPRRAGTRFYINDVGAEHVGGDRPRRRRRRLRLERARGPVRARLHTELRPAARRDDEPDLRLRPLHRLHVDHRRAPSCPTASGRPQYDGAYLYGDFVCGKIFELEPSGAAATPRPSSRPASGA